jgi:tetratricopeptide (TPR) repeat protein
VNVIASLGALHARYPMYNAQTVLELLHFLGAERVVLTQVSSPSWTSGAWRELDDPVLFALEDSRVSAVGIAPDWAWAETEAGQMQEFLKQFPKGQERLRRAGQLERELSIALETPQDALMVHSSLLEVVGAHHATMAEVLEEGPGTAHRAERIKKLVQSLEGINDGVVIASIDDVPALLEAGLELPDLSGFQPGEASRFRSIVDRAYRLEEHDDLDALVHSLLALDAPADTVLARIALEARFAASGLYLAVGDFESARDLLEAVAMGQFDRPSYLPGFVLARLGQVRDLMGERERATRAYTAALALQFCPLEAREVAQKGLLEPFALE